MSEETKHAPISDAMVELAATAVAADHYAKRFGMTKDDPRVLMNVSGNWHIFAHDARIALEAAHSLPSAVTDETVDPALPAIWAAQGKGWNEHNAMRSALPAALSHEAK